MKLKKLLQKKLKGFTLVELIVVIAIVSILAVVGGLTVTQFVGQSRTTRVKSDIATISRGLELYYVEEGRYPEPANATGDEVLQGEWGTEQSKAALVEPHAVQPDGSRYIYSVTTGGGDYSIAGWVEGEEISYNILEGEKVYAEGGNYKGMELIKRLSIDIPVIVNSETWKPISANTSDVSNYEIICGGGLEGNNYTDKATALSEVNSYVEVQTSNSGGGSSCEYDECLENEYYVISTDNSSYSNGCNTEGLTNANEKCILKIGDMYVAPGSTDTTKSHWNKGESTVPINDGEDLYDDSDLSGDITAQGLKDGDYGEAAKYCANLMVGGLDWYLPPIGSDFDLSNFGNGGLADIYVAYYKNLINGLESSDFYWSSTFKGYNLAAKWGERHFTNNGSSIISEGSYVDGVRCIAK